MKIIMLCLTVFIFAGCATTPQFEGPIEDHIDLIFSAHKNDASYPAFKTALLDRYREFQDWKPNGEKVFVLAWDVGSRHVFKLAYGSNGNSAGIQFAKNKCNNYREENSIEAPCVIFAKGNRLILESY